MPKQIVDPAVSHRKFDQEVKQFNDLKDCYIKKGWWLLKAVFPEVLVAFTSSKTQPPAVVFGALIDFTNYDFWPPSVKIVNPFTQVPFRAGELTIRLWRRVPQQAITDEETICGQTAHTLTPPQSLQAISAQDLMQAYGPNEIPFLCLPGIREYHDNPAHTGDSWLLHRGNGEGTLYFLIEQLSRYGLDNVKSLGFQVLNQKFIGFGIDPEKIST